MEIRIKHQATSEKHQKGAYWLNKLLVLLIYLTIALTSLELVATRQPSYFVMLGVALLYLIIKKSEKVIYTLVGLGVLSLFIFNQAIVTGFFIFMNKLAELIGMKSNLFLPVYEVTETSETLGVVLFSSLIFSLLIALIDYLIDRFKSYYLIGLLVLLIILQSIYSESMWVLFPLILAFFVLLTYQVQTKESRGKIPFIVALILSLISLTVIGVSSLVFNPKTYDKPTFAMKIERFLTYQANHLRYEKSMANGITHDFTQLDGLNLTNQEDLEVIMKTPESYYLRGFIGTDYTKSKWKSLDYEERYLNYGLFHGLEKQDFKALGQLSKARELGLKKDESLNLNEITIQNKLASSKYFYTPYELVDEDVDAREFNEYRLIPSSFFGQRNYQLTASSDLVTHYPQIANRIYKNKEKDKATQNYLEAEAYYNAYVYEHYTKIPKSVREVLDIYVGKSDQTEDEHPPYEQAIEWVDNYLEETLTYEEKPEVLPDKKDFISFLLKESEKGYAPHYATAATVIFRYLGIPARYVEGYLITPEMIEGKEAYEKINVENKENHAWTEIYFDEIGWLPLEFTPPYKDKMRETDLTDYPKGEWSEEEKEKEKEKLIEEKENPPPPAPETEELEESEQEDKGNSDESNQEKNNENSSESDSENSAAVEDLEEEPEIIQISLWILLLILVLFLVIYLIYFIKKRLELRKIKQSFLADDLSEAIFILTSYSVILLHAAGIKERGGSLKKYEDDIQKVFNQDLSQRFLELVNLNQAVVYGNKQVSEEERQAQIQFKDDLLQALIKDKSLFEKIRLRFIEFLY